MPTLNSPLPPDVDVTERLQTVIAEWKGAQKGHKLERLYQDCLDLVGRDRQLLPLRIIPVRELDSATLERALKHYRLHLDYAVGTIGRFESALVPVIRENSADGFLFAYEDDLRVSDQVALFAHAVAHLISNHQQALANRPPYLDPETGETHTDRLLELRYLDISENRNHLDRMMLESFPLLAKLIELQEESLIAQGLATRDLLPLLRKQEWVNQYVKTPYRYTEGRVIPHSTQRGKRLAIDVLLRAWASVPIGIVHVQRTEEKLEEAVRRVRSVSQQLRVPFAYIFTHYKEFIELHWLNGGLSDPQIRAELPTRQELQMRWLSALQLNDQKTVDVLSYPYQPDQTPRYYQEAAINQAVIATLLAQRGLRDRRILLTLATGTGKTQVAFQILWKLKKTWQIRNVLFLADRGYLLDQAQVNTFGPFRDAITRGMGEGDTAHDMLFGTYQWLTNLQDGAERYKSYPADYFDVIVIDECHRGSADEDSNWRKVLEHFSQAVQIGLTATPLNTEDVQTKKYFGSSVYTYSLSQGINDGYLAPYSVRRIQIGEASQAALSQDAQARAPQNTLDQQLVMQTGHTMRLYTQTIAEHLAAYMRQQPDPRGNKTIVFCVDNDHADKMRMALEAACADWARTGDITRIVDDDGPEGKRALSQFSTVRERQPVIVTTSRLLTTGVDVPTCKNIVLARGVGSLVEFKQIIGRGTRLALEHDKRFFTILDYAGAIKHFFDPTFDGDPTSIQIDYVIPATVSDEVGEPVTQVEEEAISADLSTTFTVEDESAREAHPPLHIIREADKNEYELPQQTPAEAAEVVDNGPGVQSAMAEDGASTADVRNGTLSVPNATRASQQSAPIAEGTGPAAPAQPASGPARSPRKAGRQGAQPRAPEAPPIIVEKSNGRRFEIIGEYIYELDASGARIREGTPTVFAKDALKDMIKTPEDLHQYWSDSRTRALLIDQLTKEVVGLDVLAQVLQLPDVDYFDLLQHLLFEQPALTRQERVQHLRTQHDTFFQRFEGNPLAKEFLDAILDMYSRGNASNLSDPDLLAVQPLNQRTRKEWLDAFRQEPTKASLNAVLKELQQLLYSVS